MCLWDFVVVECNGDVAERGVENDSVIVGAYTC